jgi:hypothetical protein
MDDKPQKFKAGLIFGTALANERHAGSSAMLPDQLDTFLDTLDPIFAPTSSRTHHGPLDRQMEGKNSCRWDKIQLQVGNGRTGGI